MEYAKVRNVCVSHKERERMLKRIGDSKYDLKFVPYNKKFIFIYKKNNF